MTENNNSRIPTKKRGRPKKEKQDPLRAMGMSKDQAITTSLIFTNVQKEFAAEMYELYKQKKTRMTIMQATARFPQDQQREAFARFQQMGARKAKRWIELQGKQVTNQQIAQSVWTFAVREFPTCSAEQIAESLELAARAMRLSQPTTK